jgi:hypothetical protein
MYLTFINAQCQGQPNYPVALKQICKLKFGLQQCFRLRNLPLVGCPSIWCLPTYTAIFDRELKQALLTTLHFRFKLCSNTETDLSILAYASIPISPQIWSAFGAAILAAFGL